MYVCVCVCRKQKLINKKNKKKTQQKQLTH